MTGSALALWVEVQDRGDVERLRRARLGATLVIRAGGSQLYGRPGDRVCIRFDAAPAAAQARAITAAMPLRSGVLVPADAEGLRLLRSIAPAGRDPLAAFVRSATEARAATAAGATTLVVLGAAAVAAIREAAGEASVVAEVADAAEADAAVRQGAHGVLVRADVAWTLLDRGEIGRQLPRVGASDTLTVARRGRPAAATIGMLLEDAARRQGGADALVDVATGRRWTYDELRSEVRRVGRALIAAGVGPGDRVALWARALPEWPIIQLATGAIGGILVTANPSAPDDELRFVLEKSGARVLLGAAHSDRGSGELVRIASGAGATPEQVVALPADGVPPPAGSRITAWDRFLAAGEVVADVELDRRMARVRPDDVASILFTSGTTGSPKGAMLSHRGMLQNAGAVGGNLHLGHEDRLCLAVPFHHCFGSVMGTLAAVTFGAALVLPGRWFDADATLRAVATERCTILYGVPTMFIAELERLAAAAVDLRTLRAGIISGAPVPLDLAERVARELHLPGLVVAYGLTEASPVVTQTRLDDPTAIRLGTVGRPIVGAEVRIVDPATGVPLGSGATGELCTRGPMVMQGYWQDPEATAATIDADGWLHTGDLAERSARGDYRIVGRSKDLIIRGGENVYPAEIEIVARRHPDVADVHVVGVPSDRLGEEVVAFVRPTTGGSFDAAGLLRFLGEHLAPFKVPREIRIVDAFPMTGSGKVQKHRLREQAGGKASAPATGPLEGDRTAREGASGAAPVGALDSLPTPTRAGTRVPALPLLRPKTLARDLDGPGSAGSVEADASPTGASAAGADARPSRPPRAGWKRPESPRWASEPGDPQTTKEVEAVTSDIRRRGQRIKTWGIGDNVEAQIEATGEAPIMYKALGTPVRTSHPFNLYGDIRSQPDALRGTFEAVGEIKEIARRMAARDIAGIVGLGSGTSQFVAQVANAAFARFAGIPAWDYDSMAFLRYPPPFDWSRTVAVGYSGSGSTVDTVAATRRCHDAGAFTVAFTSVDGSPVVKASDERILTAGGFDTGGSDTFHYTTRVAAALYLALELGRIRRPGAFDYDDLEAKLVATAGQMADMFDMVDARCQTIAEQFLGVRSILVVGGGPNYGTAEEIALKFDEMAHIPTKGMSPGRHIHGALGLTDEEILTILVAPPGTSYEDVHQIAKVTQILKTPSVAIVSESDRVISEIVDYVIRLPVEDEMIFPVLAVLPGQLIPYWSGVGLGLNPDTQRSNVPKHARAWHMLFPPGTH